MLFHCRNCKVCIYFESGGQGSNWADPLSFFGHLAHRSKITSCWRDSGNLFFCLGRDGNFIRPHRPLESELAGTLDAVLEASET